MAWWAAVAASDSATGPVTTEGGSIHGVVMGGQQPVVGAKIYLMQANPVVWKGPSTSLLTSGTGRIADASGNYYVTTSATGTFNITGDYTCTAGTQVYLIGVGGNSLGTNPAVSNAAIVQMALLGTCPPSSSFASSVPFIALNELSTVASAYSVAGYATDYMHIGRWATDAESTGLANAFLSAGNLVPLGTGNANATTPAGNGIVPQTKLNTLADIIATCVNTTANTSSACTTLFNSTPSSAGTKPVTTFDAALNLAQNPTITAANTALINQPSAVSPFLPYLATNPNDWTIGVKYTAPNSNAPTRPDVDAGGNIWIPNFGGNSLTELSTLGAVLSGNNGYTGGLNQPESVAVDRSNGVVWVSNYGNGKIAKYSTGGNAAAFSPFTTGNAGGYDILVNQGTPVGSGTNGIFQLNPGFLGIGYNSATVTTGVTYNSGVTLDPAGNLWAAQYANSTIAKVNVGSTTATTFAGGGINTPTGIASDFNGNMWVANAGAGAASEYSYSGAAYAASPFTGAGLNNPYSVQVDGYNRPFFSNTNGSVSALTTTGAAFSGANGFTTASTASYNANPNATTNGFPSYGMLGLVIDQAGNVWAPDLDNNIYEFVGLTTPPVPIVQPLQVACGTNVTAATPTGSWVADTGYVGNQNDGGTATYTAVNTFFNDVNPAPQAVYNHERYGNLTYTMNGLTAGADYTVNIHFSENYWSAANTRLFNLLINGTQVLTSFDIYAAAGGQNIGIIRSFSATADNNGRIILKFVTVKDNAKCSGIEIVRN